MERREIPKIKKVIPILNGIFAHMDYDFVWATKEQLDVLFFTDYSQKRVAPLVMNYVEDGEITDEKMSELSSIILAYYKYSWDKMKELMDIEYDPIHNFSDDLVEKIKGTDDKTVSNNDTMKQTGDGIRTRTDNLTSTETKDLTETVNGTVEDRFAGLNSTSYVNKDHESEQQTTKDTGTDTTVNTGTQATKEERNFNTTSDGKEVTDDSYTRDREVNRKGNIGNITTQQMLTQEIELWKWNFIRQVLENVRDLTTLAVYF